MLHRRRWTAPPGRGRRILLAAALGALLPAAEAGAQVCSAWVAHISAIDQPVWYNRLGAHDPAAMMFALDYDIVQGPSGSYNLRPGKRPRPLVLRVPEGSCLLIFVTNRLSSTPGSNQPATRDVNVHITGMQVKDHIDNDGTIVGVSGSPNRSQYLVYAEKEGTFLMYGTAQTTGGDGDGGQISKGLFGAVNVEPRGSEWYRSQVTAEDLALATRKNSSGVPITTPGGHPVLDYDAVYPTGHPRAGWPILRMTHSNNHIAYSDLTAIITGPNRGLFADSINPPVVVERDRRRPFREYTIIFHDEPGIVQAFDSLYRSTKFEHTLHSGRDAFAINYGTAGIGSEVIANRLRRGPMANCVECKYEEFFLSSWAVGDPAMVPDIPADAPSNQLPFLDNGKRTTMVRYPDDPSNVYHSYMNDHVKIRNLHAGPKEHHIFHLHAHQWLHSPDSDSSTYLDSQAIGPGGGFTYEITYDGGGNRNKTPGDAIFHCHFYPHFAQGMWALWRVHDVFEKGTVLDSDGRPAVGSRALPDGEIARGTPIPGLVPLPTYALAPMPVDTMPGFPFYIPGRAGHRPPSPPLDVVRDGGLHRHVVVDGQASFPALNTTDFSKVSTDLGVINLPETGTPEEVRAMKWHENASHPSWLVNPTTGAVTTTTFRTNGRPRIAGAPFADPCVNDAGTGPAGTIRTYKAAAFQLDVRYNKAGWHFPQHRMFALWQDVAGFLNGSKAPEPLFFRANTNDCINYHLVNLIPHEYKMDDFQVRSPTDIIGQHIHLVKFDVTASDGAANGFNYEDGSLSPLEVQERIKAIRYRNGCSNSDPVSIDCPRAVAHPDFGNGVDHNGDGVGDWVGAQETMQRWYVDNVLDATGRDRTLRTVFTHDHFGPSTHQQTGLYAGLVTEPQGSRWRDMHTGAYFGGRADGGPTSWKADIILTDSTRSYREFNLQLQDFTLAYTSAQPINQMGANPNAAINPPGKFEDSIPDLLRPPVAKTNGCPNGTPAPCPELVSADDPGTMTVNYRNEPLALRAGGGGKTQQVDLADLFLSNHNTPFALQWGPYHTPTTSRPGVKMQDPFTPLMWGYEGDKVQVRVLVGAHEEGHNFSINGQHWNMEPADANSGFRNSQMMGISEHYEFLLPPLPKNNVGAEMDYLYRAGSATDDLWNGAWGLLRVSQRGAGYSDLKQLPGNRGPHFATGNIGSFDGVCPKTAVARNFDVTAKLARDVIPGANTLVYNARTVNGGPLHDPTAIMYVRTSDIDVATGRLKAGVPREPLVLRALPGECINVTLRNKLPQTMPDLAGWNTLPMIIDQFNNNHITVSNRVGLHVQSLAYDVTRSDGMNVGTNPIQTVKPDSVKTYKWYAGTLTLQGDSIVARPVEFGVLNLMPADPLKQASKGAIGALVIEPVGSTWPVDDRASVTITTPTGRFRENVLFFQTDLNLRFGSNVTLPVGNGQNRTYASGGPVPNLHGFEDAEDSGQKGFNYRTEPLWFRKGYSPETPLDITRGFNYTYVLSNGQVGGVDPQTPVFTASAGAQVRFRVVEPGGHARNSVFNLHGHLWQELPYQNQSAKLGNNPLSEPKGTTIGHGPTNHFDVLLPSAGGRGTIQGDYLFRDQTSHHFDGGLWGIFRVGPADPLFVPSAGGASVGGPGDVDGATSSACVVNPQTGATTCPQQ